MEDTVSDVSDQHSGQPVPNLLKNPTREHGYGFVRVGFCEGAGQWVDGLNDGQEFFSDYPLVI